MNRLAPFGRELAPRRLIGRDWADLFGELRKIAGQGEHQGDGVVGNFLGAVVGDVADGDAALGGLVDRDIVEADADADDDLALLEGVEGGGGEADVVPDEQGRGVAGRGWELGVPDEHVVSLLESDAAELDERRKERLGLRPAPGDGNLEVGFHRRRAPAQGAGYS